MPADPHVTWAEILETVEELLNGDDAISPGTVEGLLKDILTLEKGFRLKFDTRSPEDWVCPECGCDEIQHEDWIETNTSKLIGGNENTEYWCPKCETHYGSVELRKDFEASQPCKKCADSKDATCEEHPK